MSVSRLLQLCGRKGKNKKDEFVRNSEVCRPVLRESRPSGPLGSLGTLPGSVLHSIMEEHNMVYLDKTSSESSSEKDNTGQNLVGTTDGGAATEQEKVPLLDHTVDSCAGRGRDSFVDDVRTEAAEASEDSDKGGNQVVADPAAPASDQQTVKGHQSASTYSDSLESASSVKASTINQRPAAALLSASGRHRSTGDVPGKSGNCRPPGRNLVPRMNVSDINLASAECLSIGSSVKLLPKQTVSSRMRFELKHSTHDLHHETNNYLTPTQRKDQQIRELRGQIKAMGKILEDKESSILALKEQVDLEEAKAVESHSKELSALREQLSFIESKNTELTRAYQGALNNINRLEANLGNFKEDLKKRDVEQEHMYLEMYKKGQLSAQFEREEELQAMLTRGVNNVGIRELARRLAWTESELAKWQTIQRRESYENADMPETEAEATLRFLKDSFYHFLTNRKNSDDHLRAMIRIFNYTEVQKAKVAKALLDGKKLKH